MQIIVICLAIRMAKTREHLRKVLTQRNCEYKVIDNVTAQHKNCPSSAIVDRRDLFRLLKRQPISRLHALGLRRSCSDGKARRQLDRTPTKIASTLE